MNQVHDITALAQPGANTVGLYLGNGMWVSKGGGKAPTVRAKIVIEYSTTSSTSPQKLTLVTRGVPPPPPPAPHNRSCSACGQAAEHATTHLTCPKGKQISNVSFVAFGTPLGECYGREYSFVRNPACDSPAVSAAVHTACVGHSTCDIKPVCHSDTCLLRVKQGQGESRNFSIGEDPCNMVHKHIAIAVQCGKVGEQAEKDAAPPGYTWLGAEGPYRGTAPGGRKQGQSDDPFGGSVTDMSVFQQPSVWASPAFKPPTSGSNAWAPVLATSAQYTPKGELRPLSMPLSRLISSLKPVATLEGDPDRNTFLSNGSSLRCKFPRNFVGTVSVNTAQLLQPIKNTPGVTLSLKHGEVLAADG